MSIIKKFILFGTVSLGLLALSSCEDGLSTKTNSAFDESIVFSTYQYAEYQIFSISECLGHQNSHRGRYLPWYGYNTDVEIYVSGTKTGDEKADIAQYACTPTNGQLNLDNGPFNELFTGIERANLSIKGLRQYGEVESRREMAYLLGEALTMRAFLYAELMKAYGEVPARFSPISNETMYLNKSDKDVLYKQLLADLEESFDYLYWPGEAEVTSRTDRVSLAFAKGLYARLALAASGYSLRPDDGMAGTGDTGEVRKSEDPELQASVLYPKALAALKDVIDHAGLELYDDYEQLWRDFNNFDLTAGKEVIYNIPMGDGRGRWNYTFAVRTQGFTSITNTTSNRGGQAGPVPTLFYDYGNNDQRRDVTCVNYYWEQEDGKDKQQVSDFDTWYFGKYRFEWMETLPYGGGNDDGIKPVYMRYSDILLMAAEIANELDETDYAKDRLLEVRKRAYRGHESEAEAYVEALSGKDEIFEAIVDERALEFAGEMLRKQDLIRWNRLKSSLDEVKEKMTAYGERAAGYDDFGPYLYYRYKEDGKTLEFYGLRPGELTATAPEGDWMVEMDASNNPKPYVPEDKTSSSYTDYQALIDLIYTQDPDAHQWWPIPAATINNSQGNLKNDYGF